MKVIDLLLEVAGLEQPDINLQKMGQLMWDDLFNNSSFGNTAWFEFIQDEGLEYSDFEADPHGFREDYSDKFKSWFFTYYVEGAIDSAWYNVRSKLQTEGQDIVLYRTITVNPLVFVQNLASPRPRNLGIYWSYNPECSEAHWSQRSPGSLDLTLTGVVNPRFVDWMSTIFQNISMPEECEIRLIENSPIELISIDNLRKNAYKGPDGDQTAQINQYEILRRVYKA